MEIGIIKNSAQRDNGDSVLEINGSKVFAGLTFAGLMGGLITFFTFWLITLPENKAQVNIKNDLSNFQYIDYVLRIKNDTVRKKSFILLLDAEIIEDPDDKLKSFIESNELPDWSNQVNFSPINLKTLSSHVTNGTATIATSNMQTKSLEE